jgi:hypothetical protein
MNRATEIAIIKRPGTRGYLVLVTPDGTGRTASGRPMMTQPWEFGPFRTIQGARRRARFAAEEYCTPGQHDVLVEVVAPLRENKTA